MSIDYFQSNSEMQDPFEGYRRWNLWVEIVGEGPLKDTYMLIYQNNGDILPRGCELLKCFFYGGGFGLIVDNKEVFAGFGGLCYVLLVNRSIS